MDKKKLDELSADHEKWDEHVAAEEHTRFLSDEEQKEMDNNEGLQLISIRLNKSLIEPLKQLAKLEGIGYQPLIRHVLTKYVRENEYKLDTFLSATEAADRANKLFTLAMKLCQEIPDMVPLSNQRLSAETEYSKALTQAQILFAQAIDQSKDLALQQYAKLRMAQIAEVCQRDLLEEPRKKPAQRKRWFDLLPF